MSINNTTMHTTKEVPLHMIEEEREEIDVEEIDVVTVDDSEVRILTTNETENSSTSTSVSASIISFTSSTLEKFPPSDSTVVGVSQHTDTSTQVTSSALTCKGSTNVVELGWTHQHDHGSYSHRVVTHSNKTKRSKISTGVRGGYRLVHGNDEITGKTSTSSSSRSNSRSMIYAPYPQQGAEIASTSSAHTPLHHHLPSVNFNTALLPPNGIWEHIKLSMDDLGYSGDRTLSTSREVAEFIAMECECSEIYQGITSSICHASGRKISTCINLLSHKYGEYFLSCSSKQTVHMLSCMIAKCTLLYLSDTLLDLPNSTEPSRELDILNELGLDINGLLTTNFMDVILTYANAVFDSFKSYANNGIGILVDYTQNGEIGYLSDAVSIAIASIGSDYILAIKSEAYRILTIGWPCLIDTQVCRKFNIVKRPHCPYEGILSAVILVYSKQLERCIPTAIDHIKKNMFYKFGHVYLRSEVCNKLNCIRNIVFGICEDFLKLNKLAIDRRVWKEELTIESLVRVFSNYILLENERVATEVKKATDLIVKCSSLISPEGNMIIPMSGVIVNARAINYVTVLFLRELRSAVENNFRNYIVDNVIND